METRVVVLTDWCENVGRCECLRGTLTKEVVFTSPKFLPRRKITDRDRARGARMSKTAVTDMSFEDLEQIPHHRSKELGRSEVNLSIEIVRKLNSVEAEVCQYWL